MLIGRLPSGSQAGREPQYVASLVFCSTLLSLVYLPILLAILM